MSSKIILIFVLFMNIIIPILLDEEPKIDYTKKKIEELRSSFFKYQKQQIYYLGNLIDSHIIIAFSDLNSDKLTDIITYKSNTIINMTIYNFYVHYYSNKDEPKFLDGKYLFNITINETNDISLSDVSIRNMYIGSLFNDKKLCFLVSFNNGEESLLHYVVCNENDKYKNPVKLDIDSNILIMNRNHNNSTQLLYYRKNKGNDEGKRKICVLDNKKENYGCSSEDKNFEDFLKVKSDINKPLSLKGGLGYADISGNCIPDIILSSEDDNHNRIIEVYESNSNKYEFSFSCSIKLGKESDFGAFVVTKMNDEKDEQKAPLLGLLVPKINSNEVMYIKNARTLSYSWSDYMCEEKEGKEREKMGNKKEYYGEPLFNKEDIETWPLSIEDEKANITLDANFPTIIRVGDFLGSSNPGIIVKQNIINEKGSNYSQISLFERKGGKYTYYAGIKVENCPDQDKDDEFTMGLFFDIDEIGILSLILPTKKRKNIFFFNYRSDIYFLKSKLMNDKKLFYDVNLGATFRYIVTDKKGDRHMDISYQMVQTSDMNIPLPYSLMGLDDTNNYVEYFETISGNYLRGVKFAKEDENNRKGNTPIIPNTQMMISKFYNNDKYEWNVDLIVQPMEQIWLFLFIVVVVLLIVLGFIIYLHVKELKEEQKETTKFKSWFA